MNSAQLDGAARRLFVQLSHFWMRMNLGSLACEQATIGRQLAWVFDRATERRSVLPRAGEERVRPLVGWPSAAAATGFTFLQARRVCFSLVRFLPARPPEWLAGWLPSLTRPPARSLTHSSGAVVVIASQRTVVSSGWSWRSEAVVVQRQEDLVVGWSHTPALWLARSLAG